MMMIVTAYCHCALCCGEAGMPTASGVMPRPGITIAAPRRLPFGTRVYIHGLGWRTVQDRTHRRYDGRLDVFVRNHNAAKKFGKKRLPCEFTP